MNKQELIASIATDCGLSKSDADKTVNAIFDKITNVLKSQGQVRLVGFGTFGTSRRKASTGRNPRTGESIQIPSTVRPKFTAGKALKDAVNSSAPPQ